MASRTPYRARPQICDRVIDRRRGTTLGDDMVGNSGEVGEVGAGMELAAALEFIRPRQNGVLVALKRDGRPQLSNITYTLGTDDVVRISITADRAKYFNLVRDQRASLHVSRDDFWSYVVVEADAELSAIAADPYDAAVDELVELYRSVAGEHSDWDKYRAAMVKDRRLVVRLRPVHAYGMVA